MRREVVSPSISPSFSNETRSDLESPKWNDFRQFPSSDSAVVSPRSPRPRKCRTGFTRFFASHFKTVKSQSRQCNKWKMIGQALKVRRAVGRGRDGVNSTGGQAPLRNPLRPPLALYLFCFSPPFAVPTTQRLESRERPRTSAATAANSASASASAPQWPLEAASGGGDGR